MRKQRRIAAQWQALASKARMRAALVSARQEVALQAAAQTQWKRMAAGLCVREETQSWSRVRTCLEQSFMAYRCLPSDLLAALA